MTYHSAPCRISTLADESSVAMWSTELPKTLVFFVHGFGGDAETTWFDFPGLLPATSKGSGVDLLFYRYDSLFTQATNSSLQLFDFIDGFLDKPAVVVNQSLGRDARPEDH